MKGAGHHAGDGMYAGGLATRVVADEFIGIGLIDWLAQVLRAC